MSCQHLLWIFPAWYRLLMAFEVFEKRRHVQDAAPTVTVTARSGLALNQAALSELGIQDKGWVVLLWDADTKTVGVQKARREDPNSYVVARGSRYVGGIAFVRYAGLPASRRFNAEMRDDMLCFDADGPSIAVTSNRAKEAS